MRAVVLFALAALQISQGATPERRRVAAALGPTSPLTLPGHREKPHDVAKSHNAQPPDTKSHPTKSQRQSAVRPATTRGARTKVTNSHAATKPDAAKGNPAKSHAAKSKVAKPQPSAQRAAVSQRRVATSRATSKDDNSTSNASQANTTASPPQTSDSSWWSNSTNSSSSWPSQEADNSTSSSGSASSPPENNDESPADDTTSPPLQDDVPQQQDDTSPPQNATSPPQDDTFQPDDDAPTAQDDTAPAQNDTSQQQDANYPDADTATAPSANASSSAADGKDRPNFVVLFPDAWRGEWDGMQNTNLSIRVPNVRALAKRGTRFTQAIVAAPMCAPSRAAIAAGRTYDQSSVKQNKDWKTWGDTPTFYKLLNDSGYWTMAAGKTPTQLTTPMADSLNVEGNRASGNKIAADSDDELTTTGPWSEYLGNYTVSHRGKKMSAFDVYAKECKYAPGTTDPKCSEFPLQDRFRPDAFASTMAITLLRRRPIDLPFFLQLDYLGPHAPWIPMKSMRNSLKGRVFPGPVHGCHKGMQNEPQTCQKSGEVQERCQYVAMLETIDADFGKILHELKKQGVYEKTVVAFSSDHGETLADHDHMGKGLPWQSSVKVPFIFAGPGVSQGLVHEHPVSTVDLGATILDLAGVPKLETMSSFSLRPMLSSENAPPPRSYVKTGFIKWRAVVETSTSLKLVCAEADMPSYPFEWDYQFRDNSSALTASRPSRLEVLYDTVADPLDLYPLDNPAANTRLREQLVDGCPSSVQLYLDEKGKVQVRDRT